VLRARKLLSEVETRRITRTVAAAHSRHGLRIIPVVVTSSNHYPRAEDVVGLFGAAVSVVLFYTVAYQVPDNVRWSISDAFTNFEWLPPLGAMIMGFVAGTLISAHVAWLRRLFVTRRKMKQMVHLRAHTVYGDACLRYEAEDGAGIVVLFVSLFEGRAEVVAGEALLHDRDEGDLEPIRRQIELALQHHACCRGLCRAIATTARLLGEKRGHTGEPANSHPPHVIVMD